MLATFSEKLMTVAQMAAESGASPVTCWRWLKSGKVRGVRLSRRVWLADRASFQSYLRARSA